MIQDDHRSLKDKVSVSRKILIYMSMAFVIWIVIVARYELYEVIPKAPLIAANIIWIAALTVICILCLVYGRKLRHFPPRRNNETNTGKTV